MRFTRCLIACAIALMCAYAHAATSILDADYFAFKPTNAFAVRQGGQWVSAGKDTIKLGVKARKFVLDLTQSKALVPAACRKVLSAPFPQPQTDPMRPFVSLPETIFSFGDTQTLTFGDAGCAALLFMAGQRAPWPPDKFEDSPTIKPPEGKSISYGMIQLFEGDQVKVVVFAVGVDDVQ